jgi:hypothetical protein
MQEWWLGAPTEGSAAEDNIQVVRVQVDELRKHPQVMVSWAVHSSHRLQDRIFVCAGAQLTVQITIVLDHHLATVAWKGMARKSAGCS